MSKAVKKVTRAVTAVFTGGLSETGLLKGKEKAPGQPGQKGQEKSPVAPTPDDAETKRRKERELQRKYAGAGRAGTILSGSSELG